MYAATAVCRAHSAGSMLARDETGSHARRNHGLPPPHRLLPKRGGPRESTVFNHSFVATPSDVHENVQAPGLVIDASKHLGNGLVVGVVAGDRCDLGSEVCLLDASPSREDGRTGVGEAQGHSAPDPPAGPSYERDLLTQVGHRSLTFDGISAV